MPERTSKISNLTITDSKIEASGSYRGNNVGAIAGNAYDIENCHVTDSVTVTGSNYVGGVAGSVDNSITASSKQALLQQQQIELVV